VADHLVQYRGRDRRRPARYKVSNLRHAKRLADATRDES
jgi:hypothetical protein